MSPLIFWDGRTDISFEIYMLIGFSVVKAWCYWMLLIFLHILKRWGEREWTATEGGRSGSYHGRFAGQGGGLAASQERSWGAKGGAMGGGGCMRLFRYAIGPWYAVFFEDPSGHFVLGLTWFDWQQEKILFVPRSLQNSSWTRRKKAGTFLSETLPLQSPTSQLQCCRQNICDLRERKIKGIESQTAKMFDIKQKAREIGDESILTEFEEMLQRDGCIPKIHLPLHIFTCCMWSSLHQMLRRKQVLYMQGYIGYI